MHYQGRGGIEPVDFSRTNKLTFLEGNVVKYVYRYIYSATPEEDLEDAIVYLKMMLADWRSENNSKED
jgi:hypothetical protein